MNKREIVIFPWRGACYSKSSHFHKNILFPVPLNTLGGIHWSLVTIDMEKKKIQYYDSLPRSSGGSRIMEKIRDYLQFWCEKEKKPDLNFLRFELEVVKNLPKQNNEYDCGVFILRYGFCISRNAEINFSQNDIPTYRKEIEMELREGKSIFYYLQLKRYFFTGRIQKRTVRKILQGHLF